MNCWANAEDGHRYERAKKLAKLIIEWRIRKEDAERRPDVWIELAKAITAAENKEFKAPSPKTQELTLDLLDLARTPVVAKSHSGLVRS